MNLYEKKKRILIIFAIIIVIFGFIQISRLYKSDYSSINTTVFDETKYRILVTGGAGFIGSHLCEYFQQEPQCEKIVVLDDLTTGKLSNLNHLDKVILIKESITNRKVVSELMSKFRFKYVFHFGAKVSVEESIIKPIDYNIVNTIGTIILLEEAKKYGVERFVFSSSAAIYGQNPKIPKLESHSPQIVSPYAQTKLDGEFYLKQFNSDKMKTISLRYFNVFGERQDPNSQYAAAIPKFIHKACVEKVDLPIFGDGEQTRDFVYVKDVVLANVFAATKMDEEYTGTVYNVGYGKKITINELAKLIIQHCGTNVKIKHVDPRPGDVRHSMASVDKLKSTGWQPKYEFNTALKRTIDFFLRK